MIDKLLFSIIYKTTSECIDKANKIRQYLRSRGVNVELYSVDDILYEKNIKSDIVIGVGGDGTLLMISRVFQKYTPLILPVPCGRRTILYEDIGEDLYEDVIDKLLNGYFKIQLHRRINVKVLDNEYIVLNEALLISSDRGRVTGFNIYIETLHNNSYIGFDGDGVLIGPSTGSAAYSLSTGGSLIYYSLDEIYITPLNPMELDLRPLVLPMLSKIKINSRGKTELYIDGEKMLELKPYTDIYVEPSSKNLRIIRIYGKNYIKDVFSKRRIRYG